MRQLSRGENLGQELAGRMRALEAELQHARRHALHARKQAGADNWNLGPAADIQHEEGWFMTYLDVMTLLLVAMLVMLAFSGALNQQWAAETSTRSRPLADADAPAAQQDEAAPPQVLIPEPGFSYPYPAWQDSQLAQAFSRQPHRPAEIIPQPEIYAPYPATLADEDTAGQLVASISSQLADKQLDEPYPALAGNMFLAPASGADAGPAGTAGGPAHPDTAAAANATPISGPAMSGPAMAAAGQQAATDDSMGEDLAASLDLGELGQDVEVIIRQRSVSFRINSEILFDTGQADLSRSGLAVLQRTAKVLARAGYEITVEGHTDSVPVRRNARYPSNWELSSARAGSVVRYLQANGINKEQLRAVGYADTRPIGDNASADGRRQNRRVELMIQRPGEH